MLAVVSCTIDTPDAFTRSAGTNEIELPEIVPDNKETEVKEEKKPEPIKLNPLPVYPAYIKDQCGALWGIPATLQGEYNKVLINVSTVDGAPINQAELDIFTLDGSLYLTRKYIAPSGDEAIDYYKQSGDTIAQIESIPTKPDEDRVTLDGVKWRIETSVINGTKFSYLYNLDAEMIASQGDSGGKGARMGAWGAITASVELDNGILIMTMNESLFYPINRACGNHVSEYGRMWK